MNRKQKIIVSVVGITIVLLALLGLTYAYYLTRIQGNTNTNSISVTTAKLELVYGDGTTEILEPNTALIPSSDAIGTKDFTVTNNGNDSSYVVIIDNVSITKASDGTTTTFSSNDFRYTLTCTKSDGTSCNDVSDLTVFPINGGILVGNNIEEGDVHSYVLTLWYLDTGVDQSDDMGKVYNARVNLIDITQMENPFATGVSATDSISLIYNILENAITEKNGTKLLNVPLTNVAESISLYGTGEFGYETVLTSNLCAGYDPWLVGDSESAAQSGSTVSSYEDAVGKYVCDQCDGWTKKLLSYDSSTETLTFDNQVEIKEDEQTLSVTQDDYGTSYYYRGAVIDNYVTFAGMCWRIVRIAGDGSVKIVLEDQDEECSTSMNGNWGIPTTTDGTTYTGNYGYELKNVDSDTSNEYIMSYLNPVEYADISMARAFYDFQTDKLADYTSKLKSGDWCLADKAYIQSGSSPNYTYTLLEEYDYSSSMYYDSYVRLYGNSTKEPTLKCTGTIMDKFESVTYEEDEIIEETPMYVSALTADEMVYAGGKVESANGNFYLLPENATKNSFWSLSPYSFYDTIDYAFYLNGDGSVVSANVNGRFAIAFRPSVSLASSAVITGGDGTLSNPYVIG